MKLLRRYQTYSKVQSSDPIFVAILGIIARNMPMWQRDRNMAKKFVVLMTDICLHIPAEYIFLYIGSFFEKKSYIGQYIVFNID